MKKIDLVYLINLQHLDPLQAHPIWESTRTDDGHQKLVYLLSMWAYIQNVKWENKHISIVKYCYYMYMNFVKKYTINTKLQVINFVATEVS